MPTDQGLTEFLSDRAHRASDARLALDVSLGVVGAVVAIVRRPWAWPVLLGAALCFLAFGGWAIADRELTERRGEHGAMARTLRVVRMLCAAVGALAGAEMLLAITGMALGTIIS